MTYPEHDPAPDRAPRQADQCPPEGRPGDDAPQHVVLHTLRSLTYDEARSLIEQPSPDGNGRTLTPFGQALLDVLHVHAWKEL